ncbi:hypothetical protein QCA50_000831 [Cerrena zonata]|uniref:Uncharacterized protein n=1 Tax=Cerrena zonata TaxID=2478898 RepID=A0AAW0GSG5_9APHY
MNLWMVSRKKKVNLERLKNGGNMRISHLPILLLLCPKRKQLPQEIPKLGHVQEESEEHELEIDGESNKRRPGFHRSLKQTHESMNPRHAGSLGDNKENKSGVRRFLDSDGEMNVDAEDEDEGGDADDSMYMDEEEDSFDVTLRTPFPCRNGRICHISLRLRMMTVRGPRRG